MKKDTQVGGQIVAESLYFITNQYNVREILASGFIGNHLSFDDKYYKDILVVSKGRVPLFSMPLFKNLIDKVNEHDPETSYPVILQLDQLELAIPLCSELSDERNEPNKRVCIAYSGVISLKHLTAIHFLTEENLSEFSARQYRNMPSRGELFKVSPDLASSINDSTNVMQWLERLSQVTTPTREDFSTLDRVSGAVCLCIYYSRNNEHSKQILSLLDYGRRAKKLESIPYWFSKGFQARTTDEMNNLTDINEVIFASTVTVLHSYNFNSISQKTKIIEDIRQLVYSHNQNEESKNVFDRSFNKIERVLRLEDDFEPFKTPAGHEALRGLFLFLLRPNHRDLLSWDQSETNASYEAMLTALVYSGIIVGRKGLETDYKPAKVDLEVSDLLVSTLNMKSEIKGGVVKKTSSRGVKPKIAKSTSPIPTINPLQKEAETSGGFLDFKVLREKILNEEQDEVVIKSAINFSKEMGWNDCVSTIILSPTNEKFLIQSIEQGEMRIHLPGFSSITYQLNFDRFRINISKLKLDEIVKSL